MECLLFLPSLVFIRWHNLRKQGQTFLRSSLCISLRSLITLRETSIMEFNYVEAGIL